MQGFQHKFRNDIIDAQGHGRVTHFNKQSAFQWVNKKKEIEEHPSILAVMPYLQGQLLYRGMIFILFHFLWVSTQTQKTLY